MNRIPSGFRSDSIRIPFATTTHATSLHFTALHCSPPNPPVETFASSVTYVPPKAVNE